VGHITGVIVPFTGGLIWKSAGPSATFLLGTAVCLFGLFYAVRLGRRSAPETPAG
jgi:hypothetical protein